MTNVIGAAKMGEGKLLASFHEVPMLSRSATEAIIDKLKALHLCHLVVMGNSSESICEVPTTLNKIGLTLPSGLNAVAAAAEKGIDVTCKAMNGVIDIGKLRSFWTL